MDLKSTFSMVETSENWIIGVKFDKFNTLKGMIWSDGSIFGVPGVDNVNPRGIKGEMSFFVSDRGEIQESSKGDWNGIADSIVIPERVLLSEDTDDRYIVCRPINKMKKAYPNARIYNTGEVKGLGGVTEATFKGMIRQGYLVVAEFSSRSVLLREGEKGSAFQCIRTLEKASENDSKNERERDKKVNIAKGRNLNPKDNNEEKPGGQFSNVSVQYVDDPNKQHINLPKGMSYDNALYWITKLKEEDERTTTFLYPFKGWYPFDAMWALYRATVKRYGFVHIADFKFGMWKVPPKVLTINTGYNSKQQIPWGPLEVSDVSVPIIPSISFDKGFPILSINANIKQSERNTLETLMMEAESLLNSSSIYRGKAVEVDFTIFNPDDIQFDVEREPKFMDTNINEKDLILSDSVFDQINTSILTPIRQTAMCREHKIPLKRSTLLEGKFGVGKTLTARVTAKVAEENGWTFLYLKDLNQLPQALYFANKYQPCIIFAEDIDRKFSGARTAEMDNLLNVVDGIDRKNSEVMTVFTTNDLTAINSAMLRPGRMDSIIEVTAPDDKAVQRLIRLYGRKMIEPDEDLSEVAKLLAGQIPAIIGEAVEKSKLAAIKDHKAGQDLRVRQEHLIIAATAMLKHAKLLQPPSAPKPDIQKLGEAMGDVLVHGIRNMVSNGDMKSVAPYVMGKANA